MHIWQYICFHKWFVGAANGDSGGLSPNLYLANYNLRRKSDCYAEQICSNTHYLQEAASSTGMEEGYMFHPDDRRMRRNRSLDRSRDGINSHPNRMGLAREVTYVVNPGMVGSQGQDVVEPGSRRGSSSFFQQQMHGTHLQQLSKNFRSTSTTHLNFQMGLYQIPPSGFSDCKSELFLQCHCLVNIPFTEAPL